jgi:transcriptional regulator with XRE-family HTH domain
MGIDVPAVAKATGISERAIEHLEDGRYENPSLMMIRRLAVTLKSSVCALVEGIATRPEDTDPVMRRSKDALDEFAKKNSVSHGDTQTLWDAFTNTYVQQRRAVAEARTEPVTMGEWEQKYRHMKSPPARQSVLALDDD